MALEVTEHDLIACVHALEALRIYKKHGNGAMIQYFVDKEIIISEPSVYPVFSEPEFKNMKTVLTKFKKRLKESNITGY